MIPYGRQDISEDDCSAVLEILKSDWLTQGPVGPIFEDAIASYVNAQYVVSVSSATAALHITYLALGLRKDQYVWTSPNTFVATANAALYCGASVDFIDIDEKTYCISVDALEEKLKSHSSKNLPLPAIVTMVHFAGQSCDMKRVFDLSQTYGFKIVEDASHAIGADADGGKIGQCRYSDACIFSFHPVKIVTTGEGGAITTNDFSLARRLTELRSHGVTRDPQRMMKVSEGPWYYEQIDLGFNYRLTDLQSALGLSQLKRIDKFITQRRFLAQRYDQCLASLPVVLPEQHPDGHSSFHLYPIKVDHTLSGLDRGSVFKSMREAGIGVNVHYIPVYRQPYYKQFNYNAHDFPVMENYYENAMTLPLYAQLKFEDQDSVIQSLKNIL